MMRTPIVAGRRPSRSSPPCPSPFLPPCRSSPGRPPRPRPSPARPRHRRRPAGPEDGRPRRRQPSPRGGHAPRPIGGWPRAYATPSGGQILVYQPQVASWADQRHMVAYSAVAWEAKGATKPALGSIKIEADTKVSTSERLVNFSDFKITESNFPTVAREQVREVVAEIDKSIPNDDRVIALDRVLASVDRSQITPKNVEGVKADPPTIYFSQTPRDPRQPRRRADLEPHRRQRPEVRGQHELGPLRARADEDVLPPQRGRLAQGGGLEGALGARGQAARELLQAPGRRELEGGEGGAARQEARRRTRRRRCS